MATVGYRLKLYITRRCCRTYFPLHSKFAAKSSVRFPMTRNYKIPDSINWTIFIILSGALFLLGVTQMFANLHQDFTWGGRTISFPFKFMGAIALVANVLYIKSFLQSQKNPKHYDS